MTAETDSKFWWKSKTKIGILVSSVAEIAGIFGFVIDAGLATEVVFGLITLAANLYASRGRDQATVPIDTKQILPGLRRP